MRKRVVLALSPHEHVVIGVTDLRSKKKLARAIDEAKKRLERARGAELEADQKGLWF